MGVARPALSTALRLGLAVTIVSLGALQADAQYHGGIPQQGFGDQWGGGDYYDYFQPDGRGFEDHYDQYAAYNQPYYPPAAPPTPQKAKRTAQQSHDLDQATAFQEKGVNMVRNGQLREALLLFDKCLRVQLNALGNEHPFIAQTIDLMGVTLLKMGKPGEAYEAFEKALWVYEQKHGGPPPKEDDKVIDWALTIMHMGQAKELEAESIVVPANAAIDRLDPTVDRLTREAMHEYDRAHQIFGTVEVEIPDIDIANIMHCKGSLHNVRHEYKKAYQHLRMALNDKIEILGEDDPSVAWTKNNMANSLRGLGHTQQAIELYHEALATATKHFGTDHPEVAHVHWNLALSLQSVAEEVAERRAAQWRNNWFVKLFFGTKRWAHEGREFLHMGKHLQQAFEVYQETLGDDHISTIRAHEAALALERLRRE